MRKLSLNRPVNGSSNSLIDGIGEEELVEGDEEEEEDDEEEDVTSVTAESMESASFLRVVKKKKPGLHRLDSFLLSAQVAFQVCFAFVSW